MEAALVTVQSALLQRGDFGTIMRVAMSVARRFAVGHVMRIFTVCSSSDEHESFTNRIESD